MKKIVSIIKYALVGITLVALIPIFTKGDEGVDFILIWTALLLGAAVLITVVLSAINIFANPKNATVSLISIGIGIVVVGISWALSSAETIVTPVQVLDSPSELRLTDTMLFTTYFFFVAAILAAVIGEIRNSFK